MNRLVYFLGALIFFSCSNDLDLVEEKKDIPVVYGLLDLNNENQYLRVERAFSDPTISALELAKDPAQLYYENIDVIIVHDQSGERFTLERVDGNEEGIIREEGAFADSPNYLYKINTEVLDLTGEEDYSLEINRGDALPLVTATTTVIPKPTISRPSDGKPIDFTYDAPFRVRFTPRGEAVIFDVSLLFHYSEINSDNEVSEHTAVWEIQRAGDDSELSRMGEEFFAFLSGSIEPKAGVRRFFNSVDIKVVSGGQEVADYIRIGQANLGITSSQEIPTYTNLSEGFGIFSSVSTEYRRNLDIDGESRDSLVNGFYTGNLGFQN